MNRVLISGRLTKDIMLRVERRGKPFTRFTLAVKREMGDGEDYIDCVAFGKVAQLLKKRTKKGVRIYVEGSWRTGKYTNIHGLTVWSNVVWVRYVEIIDWQYDPETDRLPPEFFRKDPDPKYPELAIADEPLDSETAGRIIAEVTKDDPYMPTI